MKAAYIVYRLPQYPVPFPRIEIGEYSDAELLKKHFNISEEEFDSALDGNVIRDQFVIDINDEIYDMIENEFESAPAKKRIVISDKCFKEIEIAEKLGVTIGTIKRQVYYARQKMLERSELKTILCEIILRREQRNFITNGNRKITKHATID